ncbi:MAG TPA: urate hydroxylase PuuD [Steroidobacteraceae bacterium]|nr:urate hydroxylase PuuD [Steroidobacteraceae bacterium]
MSGYLLEWGNLLIRWIHIVTGAAWIGSSFYFVWLNHHPQEPERPDGRFRLAPAALSTWLSGMGLLGLLYFLQADVYLIDPAVRMLSRGAAVAIAIGILIGSWLVYEALCRSRLGRSRVRLAGAVALLACLLAWGLCALFSGRGAFILFGAAFGSIMVVNVCFGEGDPALSLRARQRSAHNTYFSLPVLFVMISNHFAMTYGAHFNYLVLIALSFSGVCIRAWFVARQKAGRHTGFASLLPLFLGILAIIIVIIGLYPDGPAQ